ncbi:MAG: response regulator [Thermoplasmata archaeon]|jgi:two-component system cell cycle response regulator DivK|nr:response regulator [Thermoplasmata archaeon]
MARVLVVEDNPQNLKLSTVILTAAGHSVVGARSAEEVEAALAQRLPDLILMDIALPGKDGYTLTRELRARPPTARLPILAVSSFAMPGDAERALAAGCSAYLTKPIRRAILLQQVDALLGPSGTTVPTANAVPTTPGPPTSPRPPEGIA